MLVWQAMSLIALWNTLLPTELLLIFLQHILTMCWFFFFFCIIFYSFYQSIHMGFLLNGLSVFPNHTCKTSLLQLLSITKVGKIINIWLSSRHLFIKHLFIFCIVCTMTQENFNKKLIQCICRAPKKSLTVEIGLEAAWN